MSKQTFAALFLPPLRAQKTRLFTILLSLLALALANGLILLLINSFIKALFAHPGTDTLISASELLPKQLVKLSPTLATLQILRSQLSLIVPAVLVVAGLCNAGADYLYQMNQQALALHVARHYREKLFAALMHLPYGKIRQRSPGAWMSAIMNDVMFLQGRFSELVSALVRDTVVVSACFIILLVLNWRATLTMAMIMPIIAYGMGRTGRRISHFAEAVQREMARIASAILDMRSRFDFIRAQGGEERERQRFFLINDAYYAMISRSIWLRSMFSPMLEFIGFSIFALFVFAVGSGRWGQEFSPELMLQFFAALGLLVKPLKSIGEQISRFAETKGALNRSLELFADMEATQENLNSLSEARRNMAIGHFQGLLLSHTAAGFDQQIHFRATDLSLTPGKAIAIIGPSGAGKSTFLKVLTGLLRPSQWDANLSWPDTVANSSMVSQEPFLFDDSLRENLVYGLSPESRPNDEEIWSALRAVNIDEEIKTLNAGLETRVRAIATNFSGGQVQRLVIARALLRKKPLLVLDEATSAIDAHSERDITLRLIQTCHIDKQSLVAVTHRLQWLDAFDEVWFVEAGEIKLKGPHRELMNITRYRDYCESAGFRLETNA